MKRYGITAGVLTLSLLVLVFAFGPSAFAQGQQQTQQQPPAQGQQAQQPTYTPAEYNAYQAAAKETNLQQRIKLLDDFVAKFPNSTLMPYVYQTYYSTYNQLKNYPKTVEYADKLLANGDKIDLGTRLEALYTRELAFNFSFNDKAPDAAAQATKAREAAGEGLKILGQLPKPEKMTAEQFAEQKKTPAALFNYTAGVASATLKDFKGAETYFKEAIANDPKNGVTYYRLGLAYLQENPPQSMDGFWSLARAIALKVPGDAQVRDYLRKQLIVYQQSSCDKLIDQQVKELLDLAANSPDRPSSYTIPSAADLQKIQQSSNIASVITDLKAGGDKAKLTWLAVCGSEFPDTPGKVIEKSADATTVTLKLFTGAPDQLEAATEANSTIQIKTTDQPGGERFQKDDLLRYTATLVDFDPQPFMLHWDKVKVKPEDIPEEKATPGRKRKPIRKPGK